MTDILRVGSRQMMPAHVEYVEKVIGDMRASGVTDVKGVNDIMRYPNLFFSFASEDGIPVGLTACSISSPGVCYVVLAYVDPNNRKKGVFRAMLEDLKKGGPVGYSWNRIEFGVFMDNKTMKKVMKACGASAHAVIYEVKN